MCVCENVRGVCIKVRVFECKCERSVQSEEIECVCEYERSVL